MQMNLNDKMESLIKLSLEGSQMGDKSMKLLGFALTRHSKLQSLNLSKCKLSDASINEITDIIQSSPRLFVLLLHYNQLLSKGGL